MPHAMVTGARSSLGWQTALAFARRGWSVTCAIRSPASQALLESLARSEDLPIAFVRLDLTDAGSIQRAAELATEQAGGCVDALVHLAEVGSFAAVEEQPDGELRRVLDVNFVGPMRLVRALLPGMRRRGAGTIVGLARSRGEREAACRSAYAGSKAAWGAACDALRLEVRGFGVSVCLVDIPRRAVPIAAVSPALSAYRGVDGREDPTSVPAESIPSLSQAVEAILDAAGASAMRA